MAWLSLLGLSISVPILADDNVGTPDTLENCPLSPAGFEIFPCVPGATCLDVLSEITPRAVRNDKEDST